MNKVEKRKFENILFNLHSKLCDERKFRSLITDTGDKNNGWVVFTVSCKKDESMKHIKIFIKNHEEGYPIK